MDDIEIQILLNDDEIGSWNKRGDAVAARFRVGLKRLGRRIHRWSGHRVEIRGPVARPYDGDFARDTLWRS